MAAAIFIALPAGLGARSPAVAGAAPPLEPAPPLDPGAISQRVEQLEAIQLLDLSAQPGPPRYVNDHTFVQAKDRSWHLFGIYHPEPIGEDTEIELVHAVAAEPDPARWQSGAFELAGEPWSIALEADATIGETHLWAPHVVEADGRYVMAYQGGGVDGDHASMRLAESDDLYRWTRLGDVPVFEDICAARDPMLVRRDGLWALYYTRCASEEHRVSGVAYRASRDLVHWSEARMVLTLAGTPELPNSGYTESPFVFERGGYFYLTVTSYPLSWDATMVYRSPAPFAFPSVPFTRLRAHAAEWLPSADGKRLFMSHAGPGQRGVWMSEVLGLPSPESASALD